MIDDYDHAADERADAYREGRAEAAQASLDLQVAAYFATLGPDEWDAAAEEWRNTDTGMTLSEFIKADFLENYA